MTAVVFAVAALALLWVALWYCGRYDRQGSCSRRGGRRVLGRVVHTYWGR